VAPSTASVQGYLLVSDGPRSEPEVRRALGMSHRAASLALAQCEEWGLIERAETARRSGQRGPAATAWAVVDDHWEWFRRVAKARKERETDPVLPVIERCVSQARDAADRGRDPELAELGDRFASLLDFVRRFDHGVEIFVRGDARAIEDVFAALDRLDTGTVDRLWTLVAELGPDELVRAITALSSLQPGAARRLIALADQPVLQRLIGMR
jgi:DNA-binding transcriptional regulator GbsR (MarR family)